MTNLIQKLGVGLATATLIGASFASSAMAADITISGNGAGATSVVTVKDTCTTSVNQSNSTSVNTTANVSANTGGNNVSGNTGGASSVSTGDATAGVSVTVEGGTNEAAPISCCTCLSGNGEVAVVGNGTDTLNVVTETKKQKSTLTQKNKTKVWTLATVKAKTGKNSLVNNTGTGSDVTTGDATAGLEVVVTGSSNTTL